MQGMRDSLEGERKQVTVLFADLKSSLELLADRDPEEARQILDPILESLMEAVHHYEGTVNQVLGDGIMALFGAPLAHEDHALRACYAALRMQDAVRRYVAGIPGLAVPVRIRVGINSGEVVVRAIGGDLHMDYSAVGQTTHLAARMEQLAHAGRHPAHPRDAAARPGPRHGAADGAAAGQGPRRAARGLRADRAGPGALPAPGRRDPRAHPLRRARDRARHAPPHDGARRRRARAGRLRHRRARRRQVAPRPRVHPRRAAARVAGDRDRHRVLRPGDAVPADRRAAARLLPDRGRRRRGQGARQGRLPAPRARRHAGLGNPGGALAPGRARRRRRLGRARSDPAAPRAPWSSCGASSCGRARPSPSASCWRTCTGSIRSRSPCWTG